MQDTGYRLIYILILGLLPLCLTAEEKLNLHRVTDNKTSDPDQGRVFFSNGEELSGKITITKGSKLQINTGSEIKMLPFEQIMEIKFFPEKQEMEQKWMFPEAGKTQKEKYGDPYPVQHLKAVIILKTGEKVSGHLFSSVLFLQPAAGKKKRIVMMSKQRGKEKETFADLVYPEQIIISLKNPPSKATTDILELPEDYQPGNYEISALGIPDLLAVKTTRNPTIIFVNSELSEGIFTAIKKGEEITVFWPGDKNPALFSQVQKSIADMADFFDRRELKAVYWPEKKDTVYSLTLMIRKGKTSLNAEKSNPWRLIIQRWKYDQTSGKLLLSGKGWLFRGIDQRGAAGPEIIVSDKQCKLKRME